MLSLSNLKAFAEDLNIVKIELDELIKLRSENKLFCSSDDYYNAINVCDFYPQDYFKLRLFDYEIELRRNNKQKFFYIHCDSVKPFPTNFYDLSEFIKKYELDCSPNGNRIYFKHEFDFKKSVTLFSEFCSIFCKYYMDPNRLFIYEL